MYLPPLSAFDGVPVATLQEWLSAAQASYIKILTGQSPSEVVTLGDVVKFRAVDPANLQALIAQLQAAIAGRRQGGAIGAIFAL